LNITEGTSKSQLSRGRDLLKKELMKIGYDKM
jgi:RNA polymerase sigma-70 factor (ECF subfamily)